MSILSQEILRYLSPVSKGETGEIKVSVAFPPEFSGFKGHFPGRPVLPGVCMVQTVLVALGAPHGGGIKLRQLVSAKWLAPVLPGETLDFVLRPKQKEADVAQVKVSVTRLKVTSCPHGSDKPRPPEESASLSKSGILEGEACPSRAAIERIAEFTVEVTGMTQGAGNP